MGRVAKVNNAVQYTADLGAEGELKLVLDKSVVPHVGAFSELVAAFNKVYDSGKFVGSFCDYLDLQGIDYVM